MHYYKIHLCGECVSVSVRIWFPYIHANSIRSSLYLTRCWTLLYAVERFRFCLLCFFIALASHLCTNLPCHCLFLKIVVYFSFSLCLIQIYCWLFSALLAAANVFFIFLLLFFYFFMQLNSLHVNVFCMVRNVFFRFVLLSNQLKKNMIFKTIFVVFEYFPLIPSFICFAFDL